MISTRLPTLATPTKVSPCGAGRSFRTTVGVGVGVGVRVGVGVGVDAGVVDLF